MLKQLAEYISKYYNWLYLYTVMVVFEYNRVMKIIHLKSNNTLNDSNETFKLDLPGDIEKCWQAHILDTESYSKYCMKKFGKIIHYKPNLNNNKSNLNNKLDIKTTLDLYQEIYQEKYNFPKYELVWRINGLSQDVIHSLICNIKLILFNNSNKYISSYNFLPKSFNTFQNIIDILSFKFNIHNKNIKIFINISDVDKFILKKICTEFKINETYEIMYNFNIFSFLNNNIKSYNIIFTSLV
jgi:hypothetical protein